MFNALLKTLASLGHRSDSSLSIPVFDGAFKPNNLLDKAKVFAEQPDLSDLAITGEGQLLVASGARVLALNDAGDATELATFDQPVTALCVLRDNRIVVGLGDKVVIGVGTQTEKTIDRADGKPMIAVTALYPQPDGGILVCDASDQFGCDDWAWDLMSKNRSGRLIRLDADTGVGRVLASRLAYAFGAYDDGKNGPLVSESWAHRVSQVTGGHALDRLPGYPCRFAPSGDGGFWLTLFCSRTQLVEFVLKETDYRQEMMKTIAPKYWVAPSFGSGTDYLEPTQSGGVKQMGILKPWAPPRSYGLVVRFGADMSPLFSLHSRVGGLHHGITAVAELGDTLFVLSKGAGRILKVSVSETRATLFGGDAQ